MLAIVYPGKISGKVAAPPSKSMTQRAYAAALLHRGTTIIHNAGESNDEQAALNMALALGAEIVERTDDRITIKSSGVSPAHDIVNCGESGLAARLFTPIASLSDKELTILGTGSLPSRQMHGFEDALTALGIVISNFSGNLPITVKGSIQPRPISIDAGAGSQFLSGLLFALSYAATEPIVIKVESLSSRPYIDLTLDVLKQFGRVVTHNNYKEFYIDPAQFSHTETVEINIEGDWSGAANLLVAGAIAGSITVSNLNILSRQADRAILDVLRDAGALISTDGNEVSIAATKLTGFDFDATHSPDLFPILSVLASCCMGDSTIIGVHRLFNKESNRAESISELLQSFNVPFSIEDDVLCIEGVQQLQGTIIDSYNDHRIAMAGAIGALCANGPVDISEAGSVNKSYPHFFNHLSLCGVKVEIKDN